MRLGESAGVGLVGDAVVGYYTLAIGQVTREEAPERLTKGLARHPVPIMLLARLAVDRGIAIPNSFGRSWRGLCFAEMFAPRRLVGNWKQTCKSFLR